MRIVPARYLANLADLNLPYTVSGQKPFKLQDHIQPFDVTERGATLRVFTTEKQLDHIKLCVRNLKSPRLATNPSWTLCISGPAHFGYGESVAAALAFEASKRRVETVWADIGVLLKSGIQNVDEYISSRMATPSSFGLLVITGQRYDSTTSFRWDRIAEFLRSSPTSMSKVIVIPGGDPVSVMRKLALPVNRVLNLTGATSINF